MAWSGILQTIGLGEGGAVRAALSGLIAPFVREADTKSLGAIARATKDLIGRARNGGLDPSEYQGGTFTISNLGMFDVDEFIAIINPPQCAILAVGRVAPRVVTDGDGIEIRSMMTVSLSADHRVVDGAIGARFLAELKRFLEQAKSEDGERSIAC